MTASEFAILVNNYGRAALKAGASNSGYVIDIAAGVNWERMQEFRKQLLSLAPIIGKTAPVPPVQQEKQEREALGEPGAV